MVARGRFGQPKPKAVPVLTRYVRRDRQVRGIHAKSKRCALRRSAVAAHRAAARRFASSKPNECGTRREEPIPREAGSSRADSRRLRPLPKMWPALGIFGHGRPRSSSLVRRDLAADRRVPGRQLLPRACSSNIFARLGHPRRAVPVPPCNTTADYAGLNRSQNRRLKTPALVLPRQARNRAELPRFSWPRPAFRASSCSNTIANNDRRSGSHKRVAGKERARKPNRNEGLLEAETQRPKRDRPPRK